jgi:integrase
MGRLFKPVRKLKKGNTWTSEKWYLEYRDAAGKQIRKPASSSKRASLVLLRELENKELRVRLGLEDESLQGGSMKLSELMKKYLKHVAIRVRERTLREYKDSLQDLIVGGLGKRTSPWIAVEVVEDLKLSLVLKFQEDASKILSPRSVNRKLKALLQCLNWAKRNQLISINPLADVQMLPERVYCRSRSFTGKEVERLLAVSPEGVREVWEMFLDTGMRKKEMATLRWKDVDFEDKKLTVRAEISKSHKERRIPMSERVVEILGNLFDSKQPAEMIFPSIGNRKDFYNGCYRELRKRCDQASIEGVDVHSFRRTFAVNRLQQGVSPAEVQKQMGHATANMTLEVYAQV